MTLTHELSEAVRRGEITREQAEREQAAAEAAAGTKVPPTPCTEPRARAAYLAAAEWIDSGNDVAAKGVLAMHRERVEPRRPVVEGGDGSIAPCTVARRRADVVRFAVQQGWTPPEGAEPIELPVAPDRHKRAPCPAADAIRQSAPQAAMAYLVGKGPSLDRLAAADFPDASAPILACNEAVLAIERLGLPNPVFGVQQDKRLRQAARPTSATWLLSCQAWKECKGYSYPGAIQYDSAAIGGSTKSLTANQSLRMLGIAGFRRVTMFAFDACTSGCTDYAASIGQPSSQFGQAPARFSGYCPEIRRVAQLEGIELTWQPPREGWTVACVLRSGGRYGIEHVEWLRKQVAARVKTPHQFVPLTDIRGIDGAAALHHDWPGWWSKVELFRPGRFAGGVLYLDLDVVLSRDITLPPWDSLAADTLYAVPDWSRLGEINSSVMLWRGDACADVYRRMAADPGGTIQRHRLHGDQQHTSVVMAGRIQAPPLAVASWKLSKPDPAAVDVVVFHGDPKPWAISASWIPPLPTAKTRGENLARLCREIGARVVVEVGTKEGKTSEAILKGCPDIRLYGVDLFQPQPKIRDGEDYKAWNWDGILKDLRNRLAPYRERAVTIIADQCDAARMVPEPCDLVFLDADHRTEPTREAIRAWSPRVRAGGILAGHDYDWPTVRAAVDAELANAGHTVLTCADNVWYVYLGEPDNAVAQ